LSIKLILYLDHEKTSVILMPRGREGPYAYCADRDKVLVEDSDVFHATLSVIIAALKPVSEKWPVADSMQGDSGKTRWVMSTRAMSSSAHNCLTNAWPQLETRDM